MCNEMVTCLNAITNGLHSFNSGLSTKPNLSLICSATLKATLLHGECCKITRVNKHDVLLWILLAQLKITPLTLTEDFVFDDGETQQRIWVINKLPDGVVIAVKPMM